MDEDTCGEVSKLKWRFFHVLSFPFFSIFLRRWLGRWMDDDVKKIGLESKLKECSLSGVTSLQCIMFRHLN